MNTAWGWSGMKSILKHFTEIPRSDGTLRLMAELNSLGILDEWQGVAGKRFRRLDRVITFLESAIHILFSISLLCLATFAIRNVRVFVQ
jgi:hypothetical protein